MNFREPCSRRNDWFWPAISVISIVFTLFVCCVQPPFSSPSGRPIQFQEKRLVTIAPNCREMTDFVFSPDGAQVIYTGWTAQHNPVAGVWLNDSLLAVTDSVFEIGFTNSGEPYFVGLDSGRAFLYYRQRRYGGYDQITNLRFSRDGNIVAYLARQFGRQSLVVADKPHLVHGVIDFALSPTGDRLAYVVREADDWFVIEDGDTSGSYDWVQNLVYSRDGSNLLFTALDEDEWFVVVNHEELDHYNSQVAEISAVAISDDGTRIAYVVAEYDEAEDETYSYVVMDGQESDVYQDISDLQLSSRGNSFAFVADDGDGPFVVFRTGEDAPYDAIWSLTLSSDGHHVAYVAGGEEGEMVVLNGRPQQLYDQIDTVRFDPTGHRLCYGALRDSDFVWVVSAVR